MKLTAKEEEIMKIFWENGEMVIRDILKYIPEPKPNYNTVATQVKFLEDKGFLTRRPVANTFIYVPARTERNTAETQSAMSYGSITTIHTQVSYRSSSRRRR